MFESIGKLEMLGDVEKYLEIIEELEMSGNVGKCLESIDMLENVSSREKIFARVII